MDNVDGQSILDSDAMGWLKIAVSWVDRYCKDMAQDKVEKISKDLTVFYHEDLMNKACLLGDETKTKTAANRWMSEIKKLGDALE